MKGKGFFYQDRLVVAQVEDVEEVVVELMGKN